MTLRHLPPTAAPIHATDICNGVAGWIRPRSALGRLERSLAEALGVRHVFPTSSGRAALTVILKALGRLSAKRRVVIPAYTCFSVPAAIVRAGFEVVTCDVDPVTFDFDHARLESIVATMDPLCVVPTHLFGVRANIARARAICEPRGVFVVEDAAQALGMSTAEGPLGALGDVGFVSFGRGKTVTCGSGGAIVTDSSEIAAEVSIEYQRLAAAPASDGLKALFEAVAIALFLHPSLYWLPASLPFLRLGETLYDPDFAIHVLSGTRAGLLAAWRPRLARMNERRSANVAALGRTFGGQVPPGAAPHIRLPMLCASRAERDRLYAASQSAGLGFSLMYPSSINAIPELQGLAGRRCPQADALADRLITIPVHPLVSTSDSRRIERLLSRALFREAGAA